MKSGWFRGAPLVFAILCVVVGVAGDVLQAQTLPPPTPPPTVNTLLGRGQQTTRISDRDAGDSTLVRRELLTWNPPDSVMAELLARSGRVATRLQANVLTLNAESGAMLLAGPKAAISQDSTLVVGDTIVYNDSLQTITVRGVPGNKIFLRDPASNAADVEATGRMTYDIATRKAYAENVASTSLESGELWRWSAGVATFVADTALNETTIRAMHSTLTSCDDPNPHYHFRATTIKMISNNIMVVRPAVFYIADVPVFILPFIVQDSRQGRRSGILTPSFGFSDVIRNSPSYRRKIDNLGYYWATSDFVDMQGWIDWTSGSNATDGYPGYIRYTGLMRYKVLSRAINGSFGVGYTREGNGLTNTQITLTHAQDFSMRRRLTADLNYVTSTRLQQRNEFVVFRELATIRSRVNYSHSIGPLSISAGGTRTQYPGQELVDQTLPNLNISSKPISLAPEVVVNPNFSMSNTQRFNVERAGPLSYRYVTGAGGFLDSVKVGGDSRNTRMSLDMPLQVKSFRLNNSFSLTDVADDYPQIFTVRDVRDTSLTSTRVYARTFRTEIDWRTNFSVPATFLASTWNLTPSIGFSNVHPGAFWVRSERSGGNFVTQKKRPDFGLSVSPTIFGLGGRLGPFQSVRHQITMQIGYGYSPPAEVSDAYLEAIGSTRQGYLGSLARSAVTLQMNHVWEAKISGDSATGAPERKIKLLALNLTPIVWDFERAKATRGTGLASDRFGANIRSDLLPGLDLSADYSLFQGSILSDTATFKPFLTDIRASFSVSRTQNPLTTLVGLLTGKFAQDQQVAPQAAAPGPSAIDASSQAQNALASRGSSLGARNAAYAVGDPTQWSARLDFTLNRQRPPRGDVLLVANDAASRCAALNISPFALEQCIREFEALALADPNAGQRPPGGAFFVQNPRTALAGSIVTPLTPHWAATWSTSYDFEAGEFASHIVNLRRDLHDWEAVFSFVRATNGNFAFHFSIQLKAQPAIQWDHSENFRGSGN